MSSLPDPLEILIAGNAGQGAILAGRLIARAAVAAGKYATQTSRTGAAVRSGHTEAHVVISDFAVDFPYVTQPFFLIAQDSSAIPRFGATVSENGTIVFDPRVVPPPADLSCRLLSVEASKETRTRGMSSGNENLLLLGAFTATFLADYLRTVANFLAEMPQLSTDAKASFYVGAGLCLSNQGW